MLRRDLETCGLGNVLFPLGHGYSIRARKFFAKVGPLAVRLKKKMSHSNKRGGRFTS